MPIGPNYNYDLENQQLQQKLQIINAMQANSLKPMEVPTAGAGQVQARVSPLAAIVPALSAYMSSQGRDNIKAQQTELGNRYKDDLVNGLSDFYDKSNGGWKHDQSPGVGEDNSNADISTIAPQDSWNYQAPDQKAAIMAAMGSNHPVLQQMGQAGLASMYSSDPMSQLLGLGNPGGQQPPADVLASGAYTVNGQPGMPAPASGGATPVQGAAAPMQAPGDTGQAPVAPAQAAPQVNPAMMTPAQRLAHYFPMVQPDEARAMLAADRTGKTLAEENAHRGRMIVAGDNIFQPTGPDSVALPQGVVSARTTVKEADAGVADRHDLVTGTDAATGAQVTRTKAQAIGLTGQGDPLLAQLNPADQAQILAYAKQTGDTSLNINMLGKNGQRVQGQVDLSGSGHTGFQSGQAPGLGEEQKARGSALAAQRTQIEDDGNTALSVKARIGELRATSQNFTSGVTTPLKEKLGGLAIALGQDPRDVNARLGNVSDMQAFNKEATQMAFDMVKQLGSREAAAVVNMAVKSSASLGNTPEANKAIMDVMEGMADWKISKQESSQAWADSHNGSLEGFQTYFNKTNPISKYVHTVQATSPQPQGAVGGPSKAQHNPPAAPVSPTVPIPLDQYLKQFGGH